MLDTLSPGQIPTAVAPVCAGPKARIFAAALKGDLVRMADAVDDLS